MTTAPHMVDLRAYYEQDRHYSLEDLERLLPPLPDSSNEADSPIRTHDGPFNPHQGKPLSSERQEELGSHLKQLGLRRHYDGRYVGACPLPHDNGPSDGDSAFYISPVTGVWHCFGSSHQGQRHGWVAELIPGIDNAGWTDDISRWTGYDASSAPFYNEPPRAPKKLDRTRIERGKQQNVANRVYTGKPIHPISDKSQLWKEALASGVSAVQSGHRGLAVGEHDRAHLALCSQRATSSVLYLLQPDT